MILLSVLKFRPPTWAPLKGLIQPNDRNNQNTNLTFVWPSCIHTFPVRLSLLVPLPFAGVRSASMPSVLSISLYRANNLFNTFQYVNVPFLSPKITLFVGGTALALRLKIELSLCQLLLVIITAITLNSHLDDMNSNFSSESVAKNSSRNALNCFQILSRLPECISIWYVSEFCFKLFFHGKFLRKRFQTRTLHLFKHKPNWPLASAKNSHGFLWNRSTVPNTPQYHEIWYNCCFFW